MDIIYEIRRRHSVQRQTVTAIARDMGLSRPTVRKYLNTVEGPRHERVQPGYAVATTSRLWSMPYTWARNAASTGAS